MMSRIGWILIHSMFPILWACFDSDYDISSLLLYFNMKIMSDYIYLLSWSFIIVTFFPVTLFPVIFFP